MPVKDLDDIVPPEPLSEFEQACLDKQTALWKVWREESLRRFEIALRNATHSPEHLGGVFFLWYIWNPYGLAFFHGEPDSTPSPFEPVTEHHLLTIIRDLTSNRLYFVDLESDDNIEAALGVIFALRASHLIMTPTKVQPFDTLETINSAVCIYDVTDGSLITPIDQAIIVPNTTTFPVWSIQHLVDTYYGGKPPLAEPPI